MSELILPHRLRAVPPNGDAKRLPEPDAAQAVAAMAPEAEKTDEAKGEYLPKPTGYRLLCAVPEKEKHFKDSLLVKSSDTLRTEELTSHVLFVMRMGPDAYADEKKFPNGPYCKVGDFIVTRAYAGTRIKVYGKEFRLLNDDQVDAVVDDPRGISHV